MPMNKNDQKRLKMFREKLDGFYKKLDESEEAREKYRQLLRGNWKGIRVKK